MHVQTLYQHKMKLRHLIYPIFKMYILLNHSQQLCCQTKCKQGLPLQVLRISQQALLVIY
ncbi:hypothetical protein MTR67_002724 [Solanum verrucosum]|uniref:Uncharacterized protein n=1 Tax=Solanum verrucosum TaxID=315347 RepID=A0AAF0T929_SOLVR|nr:hypothetical protein MTR67_002724 [Solanum verrucosum]